MELLNQINNFKYEDIEEIFKNDYFKKNIFDISKIDNETVNFFEKLKFFIQKMDKYNRKIEYPLHKKTKNFIRLLYFIYKFLKKKNMLCNTQKDIKNTILQLMLIYKYLKKYDKLNFIKNIITINENSNSFLGSINLINIKQYMENTTRGKKNLDQIKNNDIKNIMPFVDDTLKSVENKDIFINNVIKFKETETKNNENSIDYKISKKNILKKIKSNTKKY